MSKALAFLKLFRYKNLIIIIFTQVMVRTFIIEPSLEAAGFSTVMSIFDFSMLVLTTVMIAAAGYTINDYFDIRIDRINKPDKMIIGRLIDRRQAIFTNIFLNTISVIIGIYLSFQIGKWYYSLIYIFIPLLLLLYSSTFKRKFLVGNIIVAIFSALVPLLIWLHEVSLHNLYSDVHYKIGNIIFTYAGFAFFISIIREMIKDVEDTEGDEACGCTTLPIILGLNKTRNVLLTLNSIFLLTLATLAFYIYNESKWTFTYLLLFIIIPTIVTTYMIRSSSKTAEFHRLGNIYKLIMLSGIIGLLVVRIFIIHV